MTVMVIVVTVVVQREDVIMVSVVVSVSAAGSSRAAVVARVTWARCCFVAARWGVYSWPGWRGNAAAATHVVPGEAPDTVGHWHPAVRKAVTCQS